MTTPRKNLTGMKIGKLTVIGETGEKRHNSYVWLLQCDCGNYVERMACNININQDYGVSSCKDCWKERMRVKKTTHGKHGTFEYRVWKKIKTRIFDKNDKEYPNYGGAGLTMEDDWVRDFTAFYNDVGEALVKNNIKYSIDRLNNSLGYVRGNCRWATDSQQARNKKLRCDNPTGINGVSWIYSTSKKSNHKISTQASIKINGRSWTKNFSISVYGEKGSLFLAKKYREYMEECVNAIDPENQFTPTHGRC